MREQALALGHSYIGPDHIILALAKRSDCLAARVIEKLGISLSALQEAVVTPGPESLDVGGDTGLTSRAQKAIRLAVREARRMSHRYLGTEHLLLGVLECGEGAGCNFLTAQGATAERARAEIRRIVEKPQPGR